MKHYTKWDIGNTALGIIRTLPLHTLMVNDLNGDRCGRAYRGCRRTYGRRPRAYRPSIWSSRADALSILVGSC